MTDFLHNQQPEDSEPSPGYHLCFNDPDDDVILKYSDGILFCVRSVILRDASSLFREILSSSQTPKAEGEPSKEAASTLEADSVDSETLEACLSLIASKPPPPDAFSTTGKIHDCAAFFYQYRMEGASSLLRTIASKSLQLQWDEPVGMYKLAGAFGWDDLTNQVALSCIKDHPSNPAIAKQFAQDKVAHNYVDLVTLAHRRIAAFDKATSQLKVLLPQLESCTSYRKTMSVPANLHVWGSFCNRAILEVHKHPGRTENLFPIEDWYEQASLVSFIHGIAGNTRITTKTLRERLDAIVSNLPSKVIET